MIRIALIGYGYWGPNLARNLTEGCRFELAAIADARPDRQREAARRYPNVHVYSDADSVLARHDIEAVVVATPLHTHHAIAGAAIDRGRHVLVEKPLAASREEVEDLIERAERRRVQVMVDHTFVYTGAVGKIRSLVTSGDLGTLHYLDSVRINLGLFQHDSNVIWDLAAHDLAIMDYLIDERPVAISAHGGTVGGFDHESIAYVTAHFASGFIGHFHVNWLAPVKIRQMLLGGRQRMIVYDELDPSDKIRVYDKGVEFDVADDEARRRVLVSYRTGDMYAPRIDRREALALMTEEFASAISEGRTPLTGAAAGLRVVTMLEAAQRSLREQGRRIPL